jgi:hypothetical protein
MTFFLGIPALLNITVAGEGSFAGDAVNGINDLRCNRVLTTIKDLWIVAAAAVGVGCVKQASWTKCLPSFLREEGSMGGRTMGFKKRRNRFQDHRVGNL